MTLYLLALRQTIIIATTLMLSPLEFVFDQIEDELARRGVEPWAP